MVKTEDLKLIINPDYSVVVEHKGRPIDTYLERFINENTGGYVEPQKKGTAKGDPVGFSKVKHTMSYLMMTTDYKEKELADMMGMPVGVLRNWMLQTPFKNDVKDNCGRFSKYLIGNMENRLDRYRTMPVNHKGKSFITKGIDTVKNDFTELWDSPLYGECVADNVLAMLSDRITALVRDRKTNRGEQLLEKIQASFLLLRIMVDYLFLPEKARTTPSFKLIEAHSGKIKHDITTVNHLLATGREILSRHPLDKRDKRHIGTIMTTVENYLGSFND